MYTPAYGRRLRTLPALPVSLLLLLTLLVATGCDSNGGGEEADNRLQVTGRVTDDAGVGKTFADIEGATVTAATVDSRGGTRSLAGDATTSASGTFTLEVASGGAEALLLRAARSASNFSARTLVYTQGRAAGTVRAMPMTVETTGEADVYLAAKQGDTDGRVTLADAVVYVDSDLAARLAAGDVTTAEAALVLRRGTEAEEAYVEDDPAYEPDDVERARDEEQAALLSLQLGLHAATSTSAEAAAQATFLEAVAEAYAEAGLSVEVQAEARQAARTMIVQETQTQAAATRFALRRQALRLAAWTTARAVEASFEASGSAQARLSALAQARTTLHTALTGADTEAEAAAAWQAYQATAEAELKAELALTDTALLAAKTAISGARTTLKTAVEAAANAAAVATAQASFYVSAEAAAEAALAGAAQAELGARVLTLLYAEI